MLLHTDLRKDIQVGAAAWVLEKKGILSEIKNTVMRRITTFRSTTDRIYDGGPIRL